MSRTTGSRKLQIAGALFLLFLMASFVHLSTDTVFLLYPVFAVNILVLLLLAAILLWRRIFLGSAIHQNIVYTLRKAVTTVIKFHAEFIRSQSQSEELNEGKKTVREMTFFMLVQSCMAPQYRFAWLHSLVAYKFASDLVKNYIASCQVQLVQSAAEENENDDASSENQSTSTDNRSADDIYRDQVQLGVYMFKAFLILLVAHYQTSRLKLTYTLVTVVYFLAVEGMFEKYLTHIVENEQYDIVEGLEQHYVHALHGLVEITLTVYYMIWALLSNHQILMLVALYTNIYNQGRQLFQDTVVAIFAEWSVLAHFEKATHSELVLLDDVCAVCLAVMRKARKTPCRHYFHGHCLRRSLKIKNSCPICSFEFQFFVN